MVSPGHTVRPLSELFHTCHEILRSVGTNLLSSYGLLGASGSEVSLRSDNIRLSNHCNYTVKTDYRPNRTDGAATDSKAG